MTQIKFPLSKINVFMYILLDKRCLKMCSWCFVGHRKKKRAVKMMVTIVLLFTICWAPFHTVHMLFEYCKQPAKKHMLISNPRVPQGASLLFQMIWRTNTTESPST